MIHIRNVRRVPQRRFIFRIHVPNGVVREPQPRHVTAFQIFQLFLNGSIFVTQARLAFKILPGRHAPLFHVGQKRLGLFQSLLHFGDSFVEFERVVQLRNLFRRNPRQKLAALVRERQTHPKTQFSVIERQKRDIFPRFRLREPRKKEFGRLKLPPRSIGKHDSRPFPTANETHVRTRERIERQNPSLTANRKRRPRLNVERFPLRKRNCRVRLYVFFGKNQ